MDCDETLKRLSTFLARDLDLAELEDIAAHLADCPPCAKVRVDDALVQKLRDCTSDDAAPKKLREAIIVRLRSDTC